MERGVENINICSDHSHLKIPNWERAAIFPQWQSTLDDPFGSNRRTYLLMNEEGRVKESLWPWVPVAAPAPDHLGAAWAPPLSLSVSPKHSSQSTKPLHSNTPVFQAESGRGVSCWGVWVSAELGAFFYQNPNLKNVHKTATPHIIDPHWVIIN